MDTTYPFCPVNGKRPIPDWLEQVRLVNDYPSTKLLRRYIQSPFWWVTSRLYSESTLPQRCVICDSAKRQLHHTDYRFLGREALQTFRPLCSNHHTAIHTTMSRFNIKLADTDEAIRWVARNFDVMDISDRLRPFAEYNGPYSTFQKMIKIDGRTDGFSIKDIYPMLAV